MFDFHRLRIALLDEIERQGGLSVEPPNPRCANGACDG